MSSSSGQSKTLEEKIEALEQDLEAAKRSGDIDLVKHYLARITGLEALLPRQQPGEQNLAASCLYPYLFLEV